MVRSLSEIRGFAIGSLDGRMSDAHDSILEDAGGAVRYLVVHTRNGLPGCRVHVARLLLDGVSWDDRRVDVALAREEVKNSPEYDPTEPVNRTYEERLYDYHGRPRHRTQPTERSSVPIRVTIPVCNEVLSP
jgi:hypothetical protein